MEMEHRFCVEISMLHFHPFSAIHGVISLFFSGQLAVRKAIEPKKNEYMWYCNREGM